MEYINQDKWFEFPLTIAKCPICDAPIVAYFDEWEVETGRVTEGGFHIDCKNEPDENDKNYDDWFNSHWSTPYIDWLPLEIKLYNWFDRKYRLSIKI